MKKSLVLAMAMALGVTASAYAANPFSDVPASHWAYDSISKLAAAGIVEGYGDSTYGGDKLMTRYEMAQIVAKAMAKGANVDALAAEFADELDNLGVRVSALEKKQDNVKITGQIRYNYVSKHNDAKGYGTALRTRLTIAGQINDNWKYSGMLQNQQDLKNNEGDEDVFFQRAYLEGRIAGAKVLAGRYNLTSFDGGYLYDNRFDGIQASYGKNTKVVVGYGKANPVSASGVAKNYADEVYYADLSTKLGKVGAHASYFSFNDFNASGTAPASGKSGIDNKVWGAGLNTKLGSSATLGVEYLNADVDNYEGDDDGYVVTAKYKGATSNQKGSWGLAASYLDLGFGTGFGNGFNGDLTGYKAATEGYKGYTVSANYTFAKNIVGQVEWYDLKAKEGDQDNATIWSQLLFSF